MFSWKYVVDSDTPYLTYFINSLFRAIAFQSILLLLLSFFLFTEKTHTFDINLHHFNVQF